LGRSAWDLINKQRYKSKEFPRGTGVRARLF
jgi:hypothetical protein